MNQIKYTLNILLQSGPLNPDRQSVSLHYSVHASLSCIYILPFSLSMISYDSVLKCCFCFSVSVSFCLSWSWSHRAACWWRPDIIWRKVVSGSNLQYITPPASCIQYTATHTVLPSTARKLKLWSNSMNCPNKIFVMLCFKAMFWGYALRLRCKATL